MDTAILNNPHPLNKAEFCRRRSGDVVRQARPSEIDCAIIVSIILCGPWGIESPPPDVPRESCAAYSLANAAGGVTATIGMNYTLL